MEKTIERFVKQEWEETMEEVNRLSPKKMEEMAITLLKEKHEKTHGKVVMSDEEKEKLIHAFLEGKEITVWTGLSNPGEGYSKEYCSLMDLIRGMEDTYYFEDFVIED